MDDKQIEFAFHLLYRPMKNTSLNRSSDETNKTHTLLKIKPALFFRYNRFYKSFLLFSCLQTWGVKDYTIGLQR